MRFQLLQYVPSPVRGEFINIGVLVLDDEGRRSLAVRMAGDEDLRRVHCLHPSADLDLLRALQNRVQVEVSRDAAGKDAGAWLREQQEIASLSLRWSGAAGVDQRDAQAAAHDLYHSFVASPPRRTAVSRRDTAPWLKQQADEMFDAAGLRERFEAGIAAERFTYPGDPFRIHYAYANGARHYIHMLSLRHSVQQSKALAFTFARIRKAERAARPHMTAIVEPEPPADPRVDFTRRLLDDHHIEVLPLTEIQGFIRRIQRHLKI